MNWIFNRKGFLGFGGESGKEIKRAVNNGVDGLKKIYGTYYHWIGRPGDATIFFDSITDLEEDLEPNLSITWNDEKNESITLSFNVEGQGNVTATLECDPEDGEVDKVAGVSNKNLTKPLADAISQSMHQQYQELEEKAKDAKRNDAASALNK